MLRHSFFPSRLSLSLSFSLRRLRRPLFFFSFLTLLALSIVLGLGFWACDGAAEADLQLRGAGDGDLSRVHGVHGQFLDHRLPMSSEAPREQQQVHLQLRWTHLQLPR